MNKSGTSGPAKAPAPKPAAQGKPARTAAAAKPATKAAGAGSTGGLVAVLRRNLYYKDQADKTQWTARLSVVVMLIACIAVFFSIYKDKQNTYFAADSTGKFINLVPLSKPNQSDATVSNWVSNALIESFDFHYGNFRTHISNSGMRWYTRAGAEELVSSMKESGNLDAVESKQMFVSLTLKDNPIVLKAGIPPGTNTYAWKLQVDGIITYTNTAKRYSNNVRLTIVVTRRSLLEEPSGLGIAKILMKPI